VEPLIRALGDEDEGVWKRAKETLVKLGGPAIEALLRALKEWNVEERAAEALGKMGEPAVEPLIRALGDENSNVRARAAWALGQLRDGQALPSLRARARRIGGDANPEVRTACRKAIAQIKAATGRKEVVPAPAPVGTGKEVTPASAPAGRGTEVRPAEEKAEEQG
jgi:hypothetical protein